MSVSSSPGYYTDLFYTDLYYTDLVLCDSEQTTKQEDGLQCAGAGAQHPAGHHELPLVSLEYRAQDAAKLI